MAIATPTQPAPSTSSKGGFLKRFRTFSSSPKVQSTPTPQPPQQTRQQSYPQPQHQQQQQTAPKRRGTKLGLPTMRSLPSLPTVAVPVGREHRHAALRAVGLVPERTMSQMEKEMDERYARVVPEPDSSSGSGSGSGSDGSSERSSGEEGSSEAERIREMWVSQSRLGEKKDTRQEEREVKREREHGRIEEEEEEESVEAFEDAVENLETGVNGEEEKNTRGRGAEPSPGNGTLHARAKSQCAEVQVWEGENSEAAAAATVARTSSQKSVPTLSPTLSSSTCTSDPPATPTTLNLNMDVPPLPSSSEEDHGKQTQRLEVVSEESEFGAAKPFVFPLEKEREQGKEQKKGFFGRRVSTAIPQTQTPPPTRRTTLASRFSLRPKSMLALDTSSSTLARPGPLSAPPVASTVGVARPRPRPVGARQTYTMYDRASMVVMAEQIEDEETRRRTEAAFLDF